VKGMIFLWYVSPAEMNDTFLLRDPHKEFTDTRTNRFERGVQRESSSASQSRHQIERLYSYSFGPLCAIQRTTDDSIKATF